MVPSGVPIPRPTPRPIFSDIACSAWERALGCDTIAGVELNRLECAVLEMIVFVGGGFVAELDSIGKLALKTPN